LVAQLGLRSIIVLGVLTVITIKLREILADFKSEKVRKLFNKVQLPRIIIVSYLIKKERELRDTVRFCIYQQLKSGLVCQNWVYYDFFLFF
jgi:hypothetical protein